MNIDILIMILLDSEHISFGSTLLETLKQWDQWLFLQINTQWTSAFTDAVFPWWRDSNAWFPLYFFLLLFAVMNFGWRIWLWIVFFILTITLTDQVSSGIIKNLVARPRPCNDDLIMYQLRLVLGKCSGGYSFTSSHATNHFGMAIFIFLTMKPYFKKWSYLFFFWAASVSYGQVYVGVHYPLDIIAGACVGSVTGLLTASFFNRRIGLPKLLTYNKIAPV